MSPRARSLMFQGTCSDAGKSVLTAALCRILLQDGYRVAPFKSQNMSLNSFVTRDGGEMGRAQVVQAQAARLDPDVRMNPVLLKPSSDVGSQVIVAGRPVGTMRVAEYVAYKSQAWQAVCAAYDSLASEYDVIVLEGAGSPGEINLKQHDIVNMKMAAYAEAPVLLVGDIDRGGVFASLVGHWEVMDDWERKLLAGYVINRFRGDASLLDPAFTFMQERTDRPVFGVVPHIGNLGLPQEDSVSFKKGLFNAYPKGQNNDDLVGPQDISRPVKKGLFNNYPAASRDTSVPVDVLDQKKSGGRVRIAVIDLPHISNFTDVEPLLAEPDVELYVVGRADELGATDAVILPGSKNVITDMMFLRDSGLGAAISRLAATGESQVVGICGGFQMLGRSIGDPHGIESAGAEVAGLGLLDCATILDPDKTLCQRRFVHCASGLRVHGYEIHHGRSSGDCSPALSAAEDGAGAGAQSRNGLVWGSYLHGLFDADAFRRWFIDRLREKKGLAPVGRVLAPYDLEPAFDRLAEVVRQSLDMKAIVRLLGLP